MELKFGFDHVKKQKFKDDGTTQAAAFDFEMAEPLRGVNILDIIDSDKAGIFHGIGESVTP